MTRPTAPRPDDQPPGPTPEDTDDSAAAAPPPDPDHVPYAPEYVIPDPASQVELAHLVPDEPTPMPDPTPPA
jgi:hypothetical protein